MSFWNWLVRRRDDHGWPGYIINGRIRTSTAALLLAFVVISWLHTTYQPQPTPPPAAPQVVPPGFLPDPDYTWVPRTEVEQAPRTVYRTVTPTPTTTTDTSPTETTPTTPTSPEGPVPTTSPTSATTSTSPTSSTTPTTPTTSPTTPLPVPNRSGTPTTIPTTTVVPGLLPPHPA